MGSEVSYHLDGNVATITIDDGKVNALTQDVFAQLNDALDQAASAEAAVVLAGREGKFSAGFDLKVLVGGGEAAPPLLRAGFELSHRILGFPYPTVIACTGHAYAMGSFLLLSADHRIGIAGGDFRITANEVAIGMTLPWAAIEICRQRLTRTHFDRATILAEVFSPEGAVEAGFLDELVPAEELLSAAYVKAAALRALNMPAHSNTKMRARHATLAAIAEATERDDREFKEMLAAAQAKPTD